MESIATGSDALIKPFPPATSRDARRIRTRTERRIDRNLLIAVALGFLGSALKFFSLPHMSWRTMALISFGSLTFLSGVLALIEVPEIYDHRVCRRCVYPYDEESQPERCPECGADLTLLRSVGYWRPWRPRLRKYLFWALLTAFLFTLAWGLI